jgi:hypothetical protein
MNSSIPLSLTRSREDRAALRLAAGLRGLFAELFALSTRQMELLDREDFDALEETVERKEALLQLLPPALGAARARGWELHNPASFPEGADCHALVAEAADLSRRLQAHERFCISQMLVRRQQVGDRLTAILEKRNAAAGYRVPSPYGGAIDRMQ